MIHTLELPNSNLNYNFNVDSELITVKFDENKHPDDFEWKQYAKGSFYIKFDELRKNRNFSSCTLWAFSLDDGTPTEIFSRSFSSKMHISEVFKDVKQKLHSFVLFIPHMDCTFEDCSILVMKGIDNTVTSNKLVKNERAGTDVLNLFMPKIELTEVISTVENTRAFSLSVYDKDGSVSSGNFEICLDTDAGYLPIRRFTYNGSMAKFLFSPIYLNVGEEVKIKAGYKYYSNVSNIIIKV